MAAEGLAVRRWKLPAISTRPALFVAGNVLLGLGLGAELGWGWGLVAPGAVCLFLSVRPD